MPTAVHADPAGRRELLFDMLRDSPQPRSVVGLADELGVHVNTVRFHLDVLQRAGRVEQVLADTTGPGRPPALFRAVRRMDPSGPTNYQLLARILARHLASTSPDPAADATELGRDWGPQLLGPAVTARRRRRGEALGELTHLLDNLGFAPEPVAGPRAATVRLRHCPFLDLVTGDGCGAVVCSLHLGLMQGALASLRGPVTVDRLDPFAEPDLCVAHLAPAPVRR